MKLSGNLLPIIPWVRDSKFPSRIFLNSHNVRTREISVGNLRGLPLGEVQALVLTLLVRGGLIQPPPLRNIALNQVIWGPGPPKLIDFS